MPSPTPEPEADAPLSRRLRAETRAPHLALEQTSFSRAMLTESLPATAYASQLEAYRVVFAVLDSESPTSSSPVLRALWQPTMARTPRIDADLEALAAREIRPDGRGIGAGETLASFLEAGARTAPAQLVGAWYVFEGSTLGAQVLKARLRAMYDLRDAGLAFYLPYGEKPARSWRAFQQRLDRIEEPGVRDEVIAGAARTFEGVGTILRACLP